MTNYAHILDLLEGEYPDAAPALHFGSPYELLVAVILSAQCTDERVNKVTAVLFARARTPGRVYHAVHAGGRAVRQNFCKGGAQKLRDVFLRAADDAGGVFEAAGKGQLGDVEGCARAGQVPALVPGHMKARRRARPVAAQRAVDMQFAAQADHTIPLSAVSGSL